MVIYDPVLNGQLSNFLFSESKRKNVILCSEFHFILFKRNIFSLCHSSQPYTARAKKYNSSLHRTNNRIKFIYIYIYIYAIIIAIGEQSGLSSKLVISALILCFNTNTANDNFERYEHYASICSTSFPPVWISLRFIEVLNSFSTNYHKTGDEIISLSSPHNIHCRKTTLRNVKKDIEQ